MATVTVEIADDEILVALKRGEDYEDVHPQLISEEAIGDRWPEYRTIQFDNQTGSDSEMLDWIEDHVFEIRETFRDDFQTELNWIDRNGKSQLSVGLGLRDAIRKAVESEDEHVHKWEKGMDGGTYVCECGAWK